MRKLLLLGLVVCMILNLYISKKTHALAASEHKITSAKTTSGIKKV